MIEQDLKNLVDDLILENDESNIIFKLNKITNFILKKCLIKIDDHIIQPLWLEAYFYCDSFKDDSCHKKSKQINNPFQLYIHEKGWGGVDLCLSFNNDYYLSFLIKLSLLDDTKIITQTELKEIVISCDYNNVKLLKNDVKFIQPIIFSKRIGLNKNNKYQNALLAAHFKYSYQYCRLMRHNQQFVDEFLKSIMK